MEVRDKELRLALVCYGGISLAIYMHGISKEIWHLVRASRAYREGEPATPGSQATYRALLHEIEATAGIKLRVLNDIIAGASAGGINGVFLAQAITTGQSLDPLTNLWLELADVEALIDPDQAPQSALTKAWARPIAWMALNRIKMVDETVEASAREEVRDKLDHFVRSRWFEPPFGGKRMLHMLLDAFDAMAAAPAGPRLLPPDQPLDLFVTVTDFGGHPEMLRLNSPPEVMETEHRLVVAFSDRGQAGDAIGAPAELAFAARATSSFPGAFPPFTVAELDEVLAERGVEWTGRDAFLARALPRQAAAKMAESAVLIDGSVLTNAPFAPAIDALRERPARRQIDRRFVYIDPTPGARFGLYGRAKGPPGFFQTLIASISELPRHQPIRDNLESIATRSDRIERLRRIVETIRAEVEHEVESLFGYTLFLDFPTSKRLMAWRNRAQAQAVARAGFGHAAYGLVKVEGVVDRIADLLLRVGDEPGPERRRTIRQSIAQCVHARGYDRFGGSRPGTADLTTIDFLRTFDLGFRIRRLRLMARRLTELDALHVDSDLRPIRDAVYAALAVYLDCERHSRFADLRHDVRAMREEAGPILDRLGAAMDLRALDARTEELLSQGLCGLSRELRRPLLLAYLGFPFFDIATLPLLQGEGLDEFDPIRVDRISPDDAPSIRSGGAAATLKGIQFNYFGAFFSRAYRENDYLWGRLHGAERMIDIVLSTLGANAHLPPGRVTALKRAAFLAILDEEQSRLQTIQPLFAELRAEIG
ncbi:MULTISPECIES: patatin-like protein [unclassified Sphingomonas]|uniref:patatin-like protein n=1 Tax=unclassified Sphingomonas TaxID=196159 RepID=UPI000A5739D2|nr:MULTISPECIES: patatin-like protein [unclassified Sphingomonas]